MPEERFRIPIETISPGAPTLVQDTDTATEVAESSFSTIQPSPPATIKDERPNKDGSNASAVTATSGSVTLPRSTAVSSKEVATPLTIELWSKRLIGGRRDLLGTATVFLLDIEQPPGDVWLPLEENGAQSMPPANSRRRAKVHTVANGAENMEEEAFGPLFESIRSTKRYPNLLGSGLLKSLLGTKAEGSRGTFESKLNQKSPVSVHLWLGKARRRRTTGRKAGKGHVVLRFHSASGLRKVQKRIIFVQLLNRSESN